MPLTVCFTLMMPGHVYHWDQWGSQTWTSGVPLHQNLLWQRHNPKSNTQEPHNPTPEAPGTDPLGGTSTSYPVQTPETRLQAPTEPGTPRFLHPNQSLAKGHQTNANRAMMSGPSKTQHLGAGGWYFWGETLSSGIKKAHGVRLLLDEVVSVPCWDQAKRCPIFAVDSTLVSKLWTVSWWKVSTAGQHWGFLPVTPPGLVGCDRIRPSNAWFDSTWLETWEERQATKI